MVVFGQKWLYSGKMVVFGKKLLCLGKCCCIPARCLFLGKSDYDLAKRLYSDKVVVFVECGFYRAKRLYSG